MKKIDYYEICNQKLKYLNYSDRTIKSYLFYINQFLNNIKIAPTRLTSDDLIGELNKKFKRKRRVDFLNYNIYI